jgi:hypothetical protein
MRSAATLAALAVLAVFAALAGCVEWHPSTSPIAFDHVWIVVQPNAPERALLEQAGFRFDPRVNRHEGQGTASVTAEFRNAFLELLWRDAGVPVAPGMERAAEKFQRRMDWRTTGAAPIGIVLHFAGTAPAPVPLASWEVAPSWMPPGSVITMLTPREDLVSPSLSIHPRSLPVPPDANERLIRDRDGNADLLVHPIGVHDVTAVRIVSPRGYTPIRALRYLRDERILGLDVGAEWAVELTFDGGAQGHARDFRPDLPLLIRY